MDAPDITVIVSSYNRPHLLADALASIRAQQVGALSIFTLVVDDASERLPEIAGVVAAHQHEGYPAQLIGGGALPDPEARGGGRCAAGINEALAHFGAVLPAPRALAFLPDDDWLFPTSLAVRYSALLDHPKLTCVYGRLESCTSVSPVGGIHYPLGNGGGRFGDRWGGPQAAHRHDRASFWSEGTIPRAANRVDHGMVMVRWRPDLPPWPTQTLIEYTHPRAAWRLEAEGAPLLPGWALGETFRCPDAGWLALLERADMGPFLAVDVMAVMKRYHDDHYPTLEGWRV